MTMKVNEGGLDRAVRVVGGGALVALAASGNIGAWGWIGLVPLATGLVGNCPLYSILGMNTCGLKKAG
jgi:hypothetical protein